MHETIRLEDMRLFAKVAEAKSFTGAARVLRMPKQTVSRRMRSWTGARHRSDASPAYVARRGAPSSVEELGRHDCIAV